MGAEVRPINNELDQQGQNQELLEQSEMGYLLVEAYNRACNNDPRMTEIKIVPIDDDAEAEHACYAVPAWSDESASGKHEVHLRLGATDKVLEKYKNIMDTPAMAPAIDIICSRLGISRSEATPQLMYVQSILHEIGHIPEFMDNEADPDTLLRRQKIEKLALPIGKAKANAILTPDSPTRKFVDSKWDEIQSKLGVHSIEELANMQAREYRSMTSEKAADYFAADVLVLNPELFDQLMDPNFSTHLAEGDYAIAA